MVKAFRCGDSSRHRHKILLSIFLTISEDIMNSIDFADIAALFNVGTDATETRNSTSPIRELTGFEIAGIGGGEGVSMWG